MNHVKLYGGKMVLSETETEVNKEDDAQEKVDKKSDESKEPKQQAKSDEKLYTDADLDARIKEKIAREREKYEKLLEEEKAKQTEAQKLAKMNEDEKAKYENEKLQKRIDELEREKSISEQKVIARKALEESDINISDDLLSMIVSSEAETTKKNVDDFAKAYKRDLNAAVQNALKRTPPPDDPAKGGTVSIGKQMADKYNAINVPKKD